MIDVPDYLVAVKPNYLIQKKIYDKVEQTQNSVQDQISVTKNCSNGSSDIKDPDLSCDKVDNADQLKETLPDTTTGKRKEIFKNDRESNAKISLKKRHNDSRPAKKDRLCTFVTRGETCPFLPSCEYSHDMKEFLHKIPADLGTICHVYNTFGYCNSGIMCRYGSCHIDPNTGENLSRPVSEGGVIERVHINILKKDIQVLLRKKQYLDHLRKTNNQKITPDDQALAISNHVNDQGTSQTIESIPNQTSSHTAIPYIETDKEPRYLKLVDFVNKVYVAPLTTVGNLPFRRILKLFGADITCGEMAMASNLESGQASEWALLRRHPSENNFGVQIAGGHVDQMTRFAKILEHETVTDFVDLNCGCPIDVVCSKGCGSSLLNKPTKLCEIVTNMAKHLPSRCVTVKIRTGWDDKNPTSHKLVKQLQSVANGRIAAIMIHGRSRLQRYSKLANWDYILKCAQSQDPNLPRIPIIGNGDIFSWEDWKSHLDLIRSQDDGDADTIGLCSCAMIGRGALIKPWLPKEIKDQQHWDISASERLDMLKTFCNYGMEHWGSDNQGINTTRRFLLEWMSFLHRYVPVGLLERTQTMAQRPPHYFGRCDLETLLSSPNSNDWIKISEMLLGSVQEGFNFIPKHKSNSYQSSSTSSNQEDREPLMNG